MWESQKKNKMRVQELRKIVDNIKEEFDSNMTSHEKFKEIINFRNKKPIYPPKNKSLDRKNYADFYAR